MYGPRGQAAHARSETSRKGAGVEPLLLLSVLACPIGMGLMMWFMARGMKRENPAAGARGSDSVEVVRRERRGCLPRSISWNGTGTARRATRQTSHGEQTRFHGSRRTSPYAEVDVRLQSARTLRVVSLQRLTKARSS